MEYMQGHKEDYGAFLGQDVDEYLASMEQAGTWGDELTLVSTLRSYTCSRQKSFCLISV